MKHPGHKKIKKLILNAPWVTESSEVDKFASLGVTVGSWSELCAVDVDGEKIGGSQCSRRITFHFWSFLKRARGARGQKQFRGGPLDRVDQISLSGAVF
jgi:hypothetical protein